MKIQILVLLLCCSMINSISLLRNLKKAKKTSTTVYTEFIKNTRDICLVEVGILQSFGKNLLNMDSFPISKSDVDTMQMVTGGKLAPKPLIDFLNWFFGLGVELMNQAEQAQQLVEKLQNFQFDNIILQKAIEYFQIKPNIWDTITGVFKNQVLPVAGNIGAHVAANIVAPGVGSVIVEGLKAGAKALGLAHNIGKLFEIKFSNKGYYDDDDIVRAGYYVTKFILELAKGVAGVVMGTKKRMVKKVLLKQKISKENKIQMKKNVQFKNKVQNKHL